MLNIPTVGGLILKKLRGMRRYYRKLLTKVPTYKLELENDHWYDMWHMHVDWHGFGNRNARALDQHLKALFLTFENFQKQLKGWKRPHQTWVQVHEYDAGQNAVYLHTSNENTDNFPVDIKGVLWDAEVPPHLQRFMREPYGFGYFKWEEGIVYVIYSKETGVPLCRDEDWRNQ